jgi:hypothetical protein
MIRGSILLSMAALNKRVLAAPMSAPTKVAAIA